ncbi:MAG: ABC-F family ATP-binding cassette domain-containing protein [Ilumatobacter sp.]|jgi:ATPase subunit of ABC transporter with duplicated ATPase domains|uniref:ABC-F family ATP-binding cassette domain-containing protein n=1 Tax=Ilumatobacter sp. TaxID=1967498 RepID=UPI003918AAD7
MPATIIARDLTIHRGPLVVLDQVDLTLAPGDRVGVVGPNGIGKSTLLLALAGAIAPGHDGRTVGTVERVPSTATVGYLPQEADRHPAESVVEFLRRRTGVGDAQAELDASTAALAAGTPDAADRYSDALERWLSLGAADVEARIGEVWDELGLDERLLGQSMRSLSGGEAARASLASLLLSRFDVVLLDEPTNDLDLASLERLERWVTHLEAPVALVSHDRTFLERTITGVVEIDHHSHRATRFNGGWAAFLAERELAAQRAQDRFDEYSGKRRALLDRGQREREWSTKGRARAKRSGEADKFIRHHQLNQTEQLAGRAARTDRAIERLDRNEAVEEPRTPWQLRYSIPTTDRSGDTVASACGARVTRGGFVLGPVDVEIGWGDRIALLGPNGAGKSTLVGLLLGRIAPSEGVAGLGPSVVVGEVEQARTQLVGEAGLLDAFTATTGLLVADARRLLAKFRLGPEQLDRPGRTLSPGERTRASMAVLMANGANLLVLDEPTNHLDLEAIEQLEIALEAFSGTVLLVTHDRSMLERVRLTRTWELDAGVLRER